MTVQLAAVPCVGSTTPNVIVFSNGKTVEIETRHTRNQWSYDHDLGRCSWEGISSMTPKCFVSIWQNSADLDEVLRAVKYIENYIESSFSSRQSLHTSTYWSPRFALKARASRLRNKGVDLKHLEDPTLDASRAEAKQKEQEQKEKKLNDLKELAALLS